MLTEPMDGVIVFGASALGGDAGGGLNFFPGEAVVVFETDDLVGQGIEFFEFLEDGDKVVMGGVARGAVLAEGAWRLRAFLERARSVRIWRIPWATREKKCSRLLMGVLELRATSFWP